MSSLVTSVLLWGMEALYPAVSPVAQDPHTLFHPNPSSSSSSALLRNPQQSSSISLTLWLSRPPTLLKILLKSVSCWNHTCGAPALPICMPFPLMDPLLLTLLPDWNPHFPGPQVSSHGHHLPYDFSISSPSLWPVVPALPPSSQGLFSLYSFWESSKSQQRPLGLYTECR